MIARIGSCTNPINNKLHTHKYLTKGADNRDCPPGGAYNGCYPLGDRGGGGKEAAKG